jgi:hypothetical protein
MNRLRLGFAFVGFGLALAGVVLEQRWVIWVAIAALGASFFIRLWLRHRRTPEES